MTAKNIQTHVSSNQKATQIAEVLKEYHMTKPCLRSGYCCKQGICPFGKWDEGKKSCAYLEGDRPGDYSCGKYSEIVQHPSSELFPTFGIGCCSSLNGDRQKLLKGGASGI